ncbi:hypothetical protein Aperf_G00000063477 [Anoplocephala perfoliata]
MILMKRFMRWINQISRFGKVHFIYIYVKHESAYSSRYAGSTKAKEKKSGFIAVVLPFYAFGIVLYFAYTIFKLMSNRREVNSRKKEEYLKDYYRNFRYVPEKGKFQMDSDSSDDEKGDGLHNFRPEYDIGWSPAPDNLNSTPDIYRSLAGLPKDLEYLLKKADDENLDDAELTRLRDRLEEMECQMTRLLEAVNASASSLPQSGCHMKSTGTKVSCELHEPDSEALYSAEEEDST